MIVLVGDIIQTQKSRELVPIRVLLHLRLVVQENRILDLGIKELLTTVGILRSQKISFLRRKGSFSDPCQPNVEAGPVQANGNSTAALVDAYFHEFPALGLVGANPSRDPADWINVFKVGTYLCGLVEIPSMPHFNKRIEPFDGMTDSDNELHAGMRNRIPGQKLGTSNELWALAAHQPVPLVRNILVGPVHNLRKFHPPFVHDISHNGRGLGGTEILYFHRRHLGQVGHQRGGSGFGMAGDQKVHPNFFSVLVVIRVSGGGVDFVFVGVSVGLLPSVITLCRLV
mmetsp:Transcript_18490/g.45797  ORF Transcript_18490/g.45797 Transcript_18490/m.45797 type:complete len:285 (+) Transcript_18490:770-1624(+)